MPNFRRVSYEVEALRWYGDNYEEIIKFIGEELIIKTVYAFSPPTIERLNKELEGGLKWYINTHYKDCFDDKGRQYIHYNSIWEDETPFVLHYGEWVVRRITPSKTPELMHPSPYSDVMFKRNFEEI